MCGDTTIPWRLLRRAVLLGILSAGTALVLRPFAAPAGGAMDADRTAYLAMARAPFSEAPAVRTPPFCWRILPSLLVWASGLPPERGFHLLTLASLAMFPGAILLLLRAARVSAMTATLMAAIAALAPPLVGYLSWSYAMTDAFAVLLIAIAMWATITGRRSVIIACLAALAVTKETWMLAATFLLLWAWRRDPGLRGTAAVGIALAAALHVAVRFAIPAETEYSVAWWVTHLWTPVSLRNIARRLLLATGATWGALTPLVALSLARMRRSAVALALAVPIVLSTAQILVATESVRPVAAAYPFVLLLCAFEIDRWSERWRAALGGVLVIAQLPWLLAYSAVVPGLLVRPFEIALVLMAGALAAWGWRRPAPAHA